MKFSDLNFSPHQRKGGSYASHTFPNGFGIKVLRYTVTLMNGVTDSGSRGSLEGLYEAAVTRNGKITFNTPVADDILGYMSENQIEDLMHVLSKFQPDEDFSLI